MKLYCTDFELVGSAFWLLHKMYWGHPEKIEWPSIFDSSEKYQNPSSFEGMPECLVQCRWLKCLNRFDHLGSSNGKDNSHLKQSQTFKHLLVQNWYNLYQTPFFHATTCYHFSWKHHLQPAVPRQPQRPRAVVLRRPALGGHGVGQRGGGLGHGRG